MKLYKLDEDYCFVEVNNTSGVKILKDEFSEIIYTYANAHFSEDVPGSNGTGVLHFDYTLYSSGNYTDEELDTVEFKQKLGDILVSIIYNQIGDDNGIESSDFEESTL